MQQQALFRDTTSCAPASHVEPSAGQQLPQKSAIELLLASGVFLAALLLLWPQRDFVSMNPDEGIVLQGAARILHGEVPYRDFFSFYTPASYYGLALAFRLFGESLLVARTILLLCGGAFCALTYLLARRLGSRGSAVFAAYLVLAVWPFRFLVLHNWDSTLYALLAFYSAVRLLDAPKQRWSFATGLFASLALMTEQSKGFGLLLGLLFGLWSVVRRGRSGISRRHWIAMAGGFALPLLTVVFYFLHEHAAGAMFNAWLWPLRHYSAANKTPYGFSLPLADAREMLGGTAGSGMSVAITATFVASLVLIPALPLIALLSGFLSLQAVTGQTDSWGRRHRALAVSVIGGLLLSVFATGRPDMSHMIYLAPLCFFLIPSLQCGFTTTRSARKWIAALGVVTFLLVTVFAIAVQWNGWMARQVVHTRRGIIRMGATDEALGYIQEHVPAGHKLLVHPYSPLYSFLSGTFNPTRFEYLQAGMHTPQQFQEAARELSLDVSAPVLLEVNFASSKLTAIWPATPAGAINQDAVADYITAHYRICAVLNAAVPSSALLYMTRAELGCSAPGASILLHYGAS